MPQSLVEKPIAQVDGLPLRRTHAHTFPGVDVALTPFPDTQRQREQIQILLDTTLQSAICVQPFAGTGQVSVVMDNVAAGHAFPSGAAQDRRAWVELIAYDANQNVLLQSGVVPDGQAAVKSTDPDLWMLRDCMFDGTGKEAHMFWEAATIESNLLPALTTFDVASPEFYKGHKQKFFPADGATIPMPARITLRVRLEVVGYDVIDDLIAGGDLDPAVRNAFSTFVVGKPLEWTPATATRRYRDRVTNQDVLCATNTNININADKFPAPLRSKCKP
jgi:hypothetical protein